MLVVSKSNLGGEAGCVFMVGSCSDHARIMVGSCSDRPRIGNDVSLVFRDFLQILQCHFSWQAQYLVRLDSDTCGSADWK